MSCYLHHIKDVLAEAGIELTAANRKQIDRAVHQIVGVAYKDCPVTWKRLKAEIRGDDLKKQEFIRQLRDAGG